MRRAALKVALATLPILGAGLAACAPVPATNGAAAASFAAVETLPAAELAALVAAGDAIVIDVRTPAEFAESRLPGALNAPLGTFDPATIPMDAERETILYCGSSRRSGIAATALSEYLRTTVRHLQGGIQAWNEAGLETIADAPVE